MRFEITPLLLAALLSATLATPLPSNFHNIERRWAEDQSEPHVEVIHPIREASSPSWPVVRTSEPQDSDVFEFTTDERTMRARDRRRVKHQKRSDGGMIARIRDFMTEFLATKGDEGMIGARKVEVEDEAPVLKPRKGMRYRFDA